LTGLMAGNGRYIKGRGHVEDDARTGMEASQPYVAFTLTLFIGCDLGLVFQGHTDFIQAFEQAGTSERIDGEVSAETVHRRYFALLQVDFHFQPAGRVSGLQCRHLRRAEYHCEQPVLHTVVGENIGERGGNDGTKTVIAQGPYRMLARRTAAEISSCQKNAGAGILGRIQRKRWIAFTFAIETPIEEQAVTVASSFRALEELFG